MTSLITTLMLAAQLNVADAKPAAHHNNRRPRAHQSARPGHRPHARPAQRSAHRHTPVVRPARPLPPPRAYAGHNVRWHNGYWIRTHRSPALIWRWNPYLGRWTVVFRF
jgi:hypothetical protein